ncbi:cobalt-zinc-cadmium resistance protein CzcB [mine drainage metagenome]|uniref:Cobalt-zinc-cadmium resistance protein CzcB n=1 Tax=mine drainage metagenome TaxID=410659 RepID=A0A1J5SBN6_9ZZZZ
MKKIVFVFIISTIIFSCKNKETKEVVAEKKTVNENRVVLTNEQIKNADIVIGTPEIKNIHTSITASGHVDVPPQSLISISFPMGGYLKRFDLLLGTSVKKGEALAVMEDQSYIQLQQDYLTAKSRMEYLNADVQRQKELSENEAASKKNYQLVLSEFKTQQVLMKALEEKLQMIGIRPEKLNVNNISRTVNLISPITGYVSKINVNVGKYVNPADVLFELVNPSDIHVAMTVFEKDIDLFKKGVKGKVALADKPDKPLDVEVILVTKNINENRTGTIHCHFENMNTNVLPGMFLTGTFELSNKSATVVPEDAVLRYAGKQYVFIAIADNQFELKEIETGGKEKGFIEIKPQPNNDWLQQKVVVKNAYALLGKLKNKITD